MKSVADDESRDEIRERDAQHTARLPPPLLGAPEGTRATVWEVDPAAHAAVGVQPQKSTMLPDRLRKSTVSRTDSIFARRRVGPPPPAGIGARFSSALRVAASPLLRSPERAEASARAGRRRAEGRQRDAARGDSSRICARPDLDVRVQLSADGHMLTWQSLAQTNNQPQEAGVFALSAVREIRLAPNVGMFRSKPPPGRFEVAMRRLDGAI